MNKQSGYTISELPIAAGIVAIIISVSIPLYRSYQQSAQDAAVLAHITELEEPLVTFTLSQEPLGICQDYTGAVDLPVFENDQVDLNLTFSLINDKDVTLGYRASVVVSADASQQIDVARDIHENMQKRNKIAPGAVLTESLVA